MCGIVGYVGEQDAKEILLKGLEKLEYRGYDSAGIAIHNNTEVEVYKEKGRIADLREVVETGISTTVGIGHTRWATHGVPNRKNAHPHQSENKRFTLVHNGVIENYVKLQKEYLENVSMKSDTDTEIVVQLIEKLVQNGAEVEDAFRETLKKLHGSYAIGLLDNQNKDVIYVAKNKSPLLVGLGENFNVIASDAMAMIQVTDTYVELMDKEIVIVTKEKVTIKNLDGQVIERAPYIAELDANDIEKGPYPHYMLKEFVEQPAVIRKIIQEYQGSDGELTIDEDIINAVNRAERVYIIACGTSYHAGLLGKQYLEQWAKTPVEVHIASEFSYNMPLIVKRPLFIFISQSGETADSRSVLVQVKEQGYPTLTVTNVKGSTLYRESDYQLLLHAGPEIAVASTKAYTAQIAVLSILAEVVAKSKGLKNNFQLTTELAIVANAMQSMIGQKEEMEKIAHEFLATTRNGFFIGRGLDYFVCLESALKLKEISYIQAEGFAGGELKHGTIALIEEGVPVMAIATQEHVNLHIRGNVKEVVARGANACIISMSGLEQEGDRMVLPKVHETLAPLLAIVPMQLMSYYASLHRGCDVDKPRNLAKSVTVE